MTIVWRGRKEPDQPQLANGGTRDLSPASDAPALQALSNWAATLPGTDPIPLYTEEITDGRPEDDLQHF